MIEFSVLGSGSRGNCVYVETQDTAILIDCGFSGKEIAARLAAIGKDISKLEAILVTHEHNDHVAGVGVMSRRYGVEVHANDGTFAGADSKIGKVTSRYLFETGGKYTFRDMLIKPFQISHDTKDPVGFVVQSGDVSLGYCTDTGKVTHLMSQRLKACNGLVLEFNHDPQMLKDGPYPLSLQQRVKSSHGHFSNEDAAKFLNSIQHEKLQHVILAHLSEKNNHPRLAVEAIEINCKLHQNCSVYVSSQAAVVQPLKLDNTK